MVVCTCLAVGAFHIPHLGTDSVHVFHKHVLLCLVYCICPLVLIISPSVALHHVWTHTYYHTMPDSNKEVQSQVEAVFSFHACLWKSLKGNNVITIAWWSCRGGGAWYSVHIVLATWTLEFGTVFAPQEIWSFTQTLLLYARDMLFVLYCTTAKYAHTATAIYASRYSAHHHFTDMLNLAWKKIWQIQRIFLQV